MAASVERVSGDVSEGSGVRARSQTRGAREPQRALIQLVDLYSAIYIPLQHMNMQEFVCIEVNLIGPMV